jgi:hypothetical protein
MLEHPVYVAFQSQGVSDVPEKSFRPMVLIEEMRDALIDLGGPCGSGERQRWLESVARKIGISFRSAKAIWYRERDYPHSRAVEKVLRARERQTHEYKELLEHFAKLEDAMRDADPVFFASTIDALKQASRKCLDQETSESRVDCGAHEAGTRR